MVQATTLASVVIPGNKLLVPQTGGLIAGIGTNNDPSISLNITGVATGSAADNTNDYLIYYDAAAGALRKVAIDGLPYEPLS